MNQKNETTAMAQIDSKLLHTRMEAVVIEIAESIRKEAGAEPLPRVVAQLLAIEVIMSWLRQQTAYVQEVSGMAVTEAKTTHIPPTSEKLQ